VPSLPRNRTLVLFLLALVASSIAACDHPTRPSTQPPTVTGACNGTGPTCSIDYAAAATINWESTNATSCVVTPGGWSGTTGSQSTGSLTSSAAFEVRCTGAGGTASAIVTVTVGAGETSSVTASILCNGAKASCSVDYSMAATISWSSTNAVSCSVAPRGWTGTYGTQTTGVLTADATFEVRCNGSTGAASASVAVNVAPPSIPGGPGIPTIQLNFVPAIGSTEDLTGSILHVKPSDHKVAVYIRVGAGWWSKPTFASPLVEIHVDGSWTCDITTGGADETASEMAAFLVTNGYQPPTANGTATLPIALNGKTVIAQTGRLR
jgi:hypothetical protein